MKLDNRVPTNFKSRNHVFVKTENDKLIHVDILNTFKHDNYQAVMEHISANSDKLKIMQFSDKELEGMFLNEEIIYEIPMMSTSLEENEKLIKYAKENFLSINDDDSAVRFYLNMELSDVEKDEAKDFILKEFCIK